MESMLLTPPEAAKLLRISQRTLWTLKEEKAIASVPIGRRVFYTPQDLQTFIDRQRIETTPFEAN